jgi:hypothetical protein
MRSGQACFAALMTVTLFACGDNDHDDDEMRGSVDAGGCGSGIPAQVANAFAGKWSNALGDELSLSVQRALLDRAGLGVCALVADVAFQTNISPRMSAARVVIAFDGANMANFATTVMSMPNESGVVVSLPLEGHSDGVSWAVTATGATKSTIVFTNREQS